MVSLIPIFSSELTRNESSTWNIRFVARKYDALPIRGDANE